MLTNVEWSVRKKKIGTSALSAQPSEADLMGHQTTESRFEHEPGNTCECTCWAVHLRCAGTKSMLVPSLHALYFESALDKAEDDSECE
jgi:hypothetical protein